MSPHGAEAPEAPFSELAPFGPAPARAPRGLPWRARLSERLLAYLPVLLMALLAALTWWLVKNTPMPGEGRSPPLPRDEPDYTMRNFTVTRYDPAGALRARIEGDTMQHFPATDTIRVEKVRLRSLDEEGRVLHGTADHAVSNGEATLVRLLGSARVVREPGPGEGPEARTEIRGEVLEIDTVADRVRSDQPVTLISGRGEVQAGSLDYSHEDRIGELRGRVHGVLKSVPLPTLGRRATPPAGREAPGPRP
jgi:lipopolysaccharide export system protein LptC